MEKEIVSAKVFADRCMECNPVTSPQEARALLQEAATIALRADIMLKKLQAIRKAEKEESTVSYIKVAEKFNEICTSFSAVRMKNLSSQRIRHIKACYNKGITLEMFEQAFRIMEQSEFIKSGCKAWANFDWIIQYNNLSKVLDGNYNQTKEEKPHNQHSYDLEAIMNHAMYKTPEVRT